MMTVVYKHTRQNAVAFLIAIINLRFLFQIFREKRLNMVMHVCALRRQYMEKGRVIDR